MKDEQIKQNAEAYTAENYITGIPAITNAYIAGAHSRDGEIKELKEEIEFLKENEKKLFEELMKENVKLRNPLISVEERLPEIEDEKEEHTGEVFVCIKNDVYLVAHYSYFYKAWYTFSEKGGCMYRKIKTPRYWMPIPQIEKGDEE